MARWGGVGVGLPLPVNSWGHVTCVLTARVLKVGLKFQVRNRDCFWRPLYLERVCWRERAEHLKRKLHLCCLGTQPQDTADFAFDPQGFPRTLPGPDSVPSRMSGRAAAPHYLSIGVGFHLLSGHNWLEMNPISTPHAPRPSASSSLGWRLGEFVR